MTNFKVLVACFCFLLCDGAMSINPANLNEELPKNFESSLPVYLQNCASKLSVNDIESAANELMEFNKNAPCFLSDFIGCSFEETKKKLSEYLTAVKTYYARGDIYDKTYKVEEYVYDSLLGALYVDYCNMIQNLESSLRVLDESSKRALIDIVACDVPVHSSLSVDKL